MCGTFPSQFAAVLEVSQKDIEDNIRFEGTDAYIKVGNCTKCKLLSVPNCQSHMSIILLD
jgi:hypothetical protein